MKLNFGCGKTLLEGYINYDKYQKGTGITYIDLEKPLPFDNNSVDEIVMNHTIEHINNEYQLVVECHRILKKDGVLKIRVPTTSHTYAHVRPVHTFAYYHGLTGNARLKYGQNKPLFDIKVKGHLRSLMFCYYRLRNWFYNKIYDEWEYEMVKR